MNIINKVYAVDPWGELENPVSSNLSSWEGVLAKVYELLNFLIPFSALIAVVMLVVGGYSLITAMGDPDKIKKGSDIITAAVVGMVLVLLSKLIVTFLINNILPT
jgi:type IV secretory pathway VirB2 component (pilin)